MKHKEPVYRLDMSINSGMPTSLQFLFGTEAMLGDVCSDEKMDISRQITSDVLCYLNGEVAESPHITEMACLATRTFSLKSPELDLGYGRFCRFGNLTYKLTYASASTEDEIYRVIYASFSDAELHWHGEIYRPIATHGLLGFSGGTYHSRLGYTDTMFDHLGYLQELQDPKPPALAPLMEMILFEEVDN